MHIKRQGYCISVKAHHIHILYEFELKLHIRKYQTLRRSNREEGILHSFF